MFKDWAHYNPVRVECVSIDKITQYIHAGHILLVTTPGFSERGVVQRITEILAPRVVTIWDGVKANPDIQDLDVAVMQLSSLGVGVVVGLGGGSALDAAKVLATMLRNSMSTTLKQVYRESRQVPWRERLPLIVIPTTSGTGSEVTPFATIWDHEQKKKYSLSGDFIFPDVALLDADLTVSLGKDDTLYPALDAISHALESLWNRNATPVSDAYALTALTILNEFLPKVLNNPQNLENRKKLQAASTLAGLAISQTKTAVAHAVSYSITSLYGVPHGLACSFLLEMFIEGYLDETKNKSEWCCIKETQNILRSLDLRSKLNKYCDLVHVLDNISVNEERLYNSKIAYDKEKTTRWLENNSVGRFRSNCEA